MANTVGLLMRTLCILILLYGVFGSDCPTDWSFPACPRPDIDEPSLDTCCTVDGEQICCESSDVLESWPIWLIILLSIAFLVGIVLLCCCGCCLCLFQTCEKMLSMILNMFREKND
ncbi:uncharacterized protein [Amphiura filiformis]|uniref:uncharacterized protein n=1 Tax=Amphiura filiformis TaxID=82378 RepID=UPI003B21F80A